MNEAEARGQIVRYAKSLFDRGYSVGSAGNISVAIDDGLLITPTNSSLGWLDVDEISKLDRDGKHISGLAPSKEIYLHRAFYRTRPGTGAVVHLHSTYGTALSCLDHKNAEDCVPPITPYLVMKVGKVGLVPYFRPGDAAAAGLIEALGGRFAAVLLANHGPVVSGPDLRSAVFAAEELEETAKLVVTLGAAPVRLLTPDQVEELMRTFPS